MNKIILLVIAFLCTCSMFTSCGKDELGESEQPIVSLTAVDYTTDGYFDGVLYYQILSNVDNTVEITKGSNNASVVKIPEYVKINGTKYAVTSIRSKAFYEYENLNSVVFSNNISSIGNEAFTHCSHLASLVFGKNTPSIGYHAFNGLQISRLEFADMKSLGEIMCQSILGEHGFSGQLFIKEKEVHEITIPNSVTCIDDCAFSYCIGLTSITISNSVTSIGDNAFFRCTGLTSITIPNSVKSIGDNAFLGCTGLTSITIPSSVTSIGNGAFSDCYGLKKIIVPDIAAWCKIEFEFRRSENNYNYSNPLYWARHIFSDETTEITNLEIPNSVTSINDYAFHGCAGLTSITIPSSVTSIGNGAFWNCTGLKKIIVPDIAAWCKISFGNGSSNPLYCAHHIFSDETTGITNLEIPSSVTSIRNYAFYGCTGLTSITIPSSVTSIGNGAFSGCTGLTSITIPSSVTSIGNGAFSGCTGLTSITIPSSVTSIGDYAFYGCTGLTSITIPSSVTSIGNGAFYGCTGLTSIIIPNSVTSIGSSAFFDCNNLEWVKVEATTPPSCGVNIFKSGTGQGASYPIYVPQSSVDIYKNTFGWTEYYKRIQGF